MIVIVWNPEIVWLKSTLFLDINVVLFISAIYM